MPINGLSLQKLPRAITAHFDERAYGEATVALWTTTRIAVQRVWPWLQAAVAAYGPTHRKRDVWAELEARTAQLWATEHGAIVTMVETWPSGLKECRFWLAGGDLDAVLAMRPDIEAWARERGCERCVVSGRLGWKRALPSYRPTIASFVKELA